MSKVSNMQTGRLFTAFMMALFIVILLTMMMFGARLFEATFGQKASNDTARLGQSLIANIVRSNDAADAVTTAQGPEGAALVLVERTDNGTFETRVYEYRGNIVEEYTLQGNDFSPESATVVVASQTFDFSLDGNELALRTDQGESIVALRCPQGGEAS